MAVPPRGRCRQRPHVPSGFPVLPHSPFSRALISPETPPSGTTFSKSVQLTEKGQLRKTEEAFLKGSVLQDDA